MVREVSRSYGGHAYKSLESVKEHKKHGLKISVRTATSATTSLKGRVTVITGKKAIEKLAGKAAKYMVRVGETYSRVGKHVSKLK